MTPAGPARVTVPARAAGLIGLFTAAEVVAVCFTPVAFDAAGRAVVVALLGIQAVTLLRAQAEPVLCAAIVIVLGVVVAALTTSIGPGLAPAALFALAYGTPGTVSRFGLAAVVLGSPVSLIRSPWPAVPITVATAVAVWALGGLLRAQAAQQAEAAHAVAAQERAALAREVHDVVGHSLASIIVQAGVAADAFDRDPAQARQAVAAIDGNARAALGEVRRAIAGTGQQRGLDGLAALVDGLSSSDISVTMQVEGDTSTVSPELGASVFRIVQESLTNSLRHGSARTIAVEVRCADDRIEVRVTDDGCGAPVGAPPVRSVGGHGIAGMRARAESHGGSLCAGPGIDGGFRVEASLPVDGS